MVVKTQILNVLQTRNASRHWNYILFYVESLIYLYNCRSELWLWWEPLKSRPWQFYVNLYTLKPQFLPETEMNIVSNVSILCLLYQFCTIVRLLCILTRLFEYFLEFISNTKWCSLQKALYCQANVSFVVYFWLVHLWTCHIPNHAIFLLLLLFSFSLLHRGIIIISWLVGPIVRDTCSSGWCR